MEDLDDRDASASSTFTTEHQGPGGAGPELSSQPATDAYAGDVMASIMRYLAPIAPAPPGRVRVQFVVGRNGIEPTGLVFLEPSRSRDGGGDGTAGADAHGGFGLGFGSVPASGVAMACLPDTTVGDGDGEARGSGECAVCLEEYVAGDTLRTMPCAHGFHERCIFQWLQLSCLCPLCRFALPPEE